MAQHRRTYLSARLGRALDRLGADHPDLHVDVADGFVSIWSTPPPARPEPPDPDDEWSVPDPDALAAWRADLAAWEDTAEVWEVDPFADLLGEPARVGGRRPEATSGPYTPSDVFSLADRLGYSPRLTHLRRRSASGTLASTPAPTPAPVDPGACSVPASLPDDWPPDLVAYIGRLIHGPKRDHAIALAQAILEGQPEPSPPAAGWAAKNEAKVRRYCRTRQAVAA